MTILVLLIGLICWVLGFEAGKAYGRSHPENHE